MSSQQEGKPTTNLQDFFQTLIKNGDHIEEVYEKFADRYDGLISNWSPAEKFVQEFHSLLPRKDAQLLDVACGSGQLGKALFTMGYRYVDALDGCKRIFEEAVKNAIPYGKFIEVLVKPETVIPLDNGSYDAALICNAVFTDHITPSAFPQLIRLIKPGGYLGWYRSNYLCEPWSKFNIPREEYEVVLDSLQKQGLVESVDGFYPKVVFECPSVKKQEVWFFKVK